MTLEECARIINAYADQAYIDPTQREVRRKELHESFERWRAVPGGDFWFNGGARNAPLLLALKYDDPEDDIEVMLTTVQDMEWCDRPVAKVEAAE